MTYEDEELDIEPYEGDPEFDRPQDLDGEQDDSFHGVPQTQRFAASSPVDLSRTWKEALEWYREHESAGEIGFNPDGMCLKVCRVARRIPARYLTAKQAQDATPKEFRIEKVRDLRRGMVLYYDELNDSNRAGHIVTQIGRVKGSDKNKLSDILVVTNDVQSGRLTVVRGDYFEKHWGDKFQFGATILNGVELDFPSPKPKSENPTRIENFHDSKPEFDLGILRRAAQNRPEAARILSLIQAHAGALKGNNDDIVKFRKRVFEDDVVDLRLLNKLVNDGRVGRTKRIRDEIRRLIDSLPEE